MNRGATVVSTSHGDRVGRRAFVALTMIGAIAAATATLSGCGSNNRERGIVTGKVTYQGEPLRFGTVIFEPEAGQYATGTIQPDGTFRMTTRGEGEGAPTGKNRVRFVCFANQDPSAKPAELENGPMQGESLVMGAALIPEKYLSSATSGITVDVKPGDNEPLVFELTNP